ncbi:MAG TPA: hypothetical protein VID93_02080 [Acidimicrobiales bacterium]
MPRGRPATRHTDILPPTAARAEDRWFRGYLTSQGLDDTNEEILRHWQGLPLRRLEPTTEPGPPPLTADLACVWLVPASALVLGLLAHRRRP